MTITTLFFLFTVILPCFSGKLKDLKKDHRFHKEFYKVKPEKRQKLEDRLKNVPQIDFDLLHTDQDGELFYEEPVDELLKVSTTQKRELLENLDYSAINDVAEIPILHSRYGAASILYLDFDGETIAQGTTSWEENTNAILNAEPFSLDTNKAAMNAAEQDAINLMWRMVAEDYSSWNIDVTTENPFNYTNYSILNVAHIVISGSTTGLPSSTGGGVAFVGIMGKTGAPQLRPGFCYAPNLGPNNPSYIAECISHEAGHNMGLHHDGYTDGTNENPYYKGLGVWAPIMGASYGKSVTQWSKGEYPGANNQEDDIAIIGGVLGLAPLLTLGVKSGTCNEASYLLRPNALTASFKITVTAIPVSILAYPPTSGVGDGDLGISVNCGGTVFTNAPTGDVNASLILTSIAVGTSCSVDVTSFGDSTVPYSNYGSVGRFTLSICNGNIVDILTPPASPPSITPDPPPPTPPSPPRCVFYLDQNYGDSSAALTAGQYYATLTSTWDKRVSSVKVTGNVYFILYSSAQRTGTSFTGACGASYTSLSSFDNMASSMSCKACTPSIEQSTSMETSVDMPADAAFVPGWGWALLGIGTIVLIAIPLSIVAYRNSHKDSEIV